MKWTEPYNPIPHHTIYSEIHFCITAQTPIGVMKISWGGYEDDTLFDIKINNKWIGVCSDLEEAKEFCLDYLKEIAGKLSEYINTDRNIK